MKQETGVADAAIDAVDELYDRCLKGTVSERIDAKIALKKQILNLAAALSSATPAGGGLRSVVIAHIADLRRCLPTLKAYRLMATFDEFEKAAIELETALAASPVPMSDTGAQEVLRERDEGFYAGVVAALAVVRTFDQETAWHEIVNTAGPELLQYAAYVEPEDWEFAGFAQYLKRKPKRTALASPPPQSAPKDAQPDSIMANLKALKVGDSSFEGWFSTKVMIGLGTKQLMRDAYAAGMEDPLVASVLSTPQASQSAPVAGMTDAEILSLAYDVGAMPEQMTDSELCRFARAIEAALRSYEMMRRIGKSKRFSFEGACDAVDQATNKDTP